MRRRQTLAFALAAVSVVPGTGCSFIAVEPARVRANPTFVNMNCTDSAGLPTVDAILGILLSFKTLNTYVSPAAEFQGSFLTRDQELAAAATLTTLAFLSTVYGGRSVRECTRLKANRAREDFDGDGDDATDASPPIRRGHARPVPPKVEPAPNPPLHEIPDS